MLSSFPREKVKLIKRSSVVIEDIDAVVQSDLIVIDDASLDIEEGDTIERVLPTGKSEYYLVLDRGYFAAHGRFPAHYQASVRKQSSIDLDKGKNVVNNYNIGTAEKININSTDNSVTYNVSSEDRALMETLKMVAKELENKDAIIQSIEEMKSSIGKKSFAEKYNAFIQNVANHMTIFASYIPALTQILTNSIK